MGKLVLYHGTSDKTVQPAYGLGEEKHDYGKGFYLTENLELAKEWAVCKPNEANGFVHKYELDTRRYKMLSEKFIAKYGIDTESYDVIKGWRANASYFYIAKEFVRDNIDMDILEELLSLGGLGIQYCIKSEAAYAKLQEVSDGLTVVPYAEFNEKYNQRDIMARRKMRELVDSEANKVTRVFSTLF